MPTIVVHPIKIVDRKKNEEEEEEEKTFVCVRKCSFYVENDKQSSSY